MLLGHLGSIRDDTERPALYDVHKELAELIVPSDFEGFGFSEIWLMDCGPKYTLRRDPRTPADFFCVAPAETIGFWERERKRHPYWGLIRDFLTQGSISDAVDRKFARDLLADDPDLDVAAFLQDCEALSQSP